MNIYVLGSLLAMRRGARREMKSEGPEKQGAKLRERCVLAAVQKDEFAKGREEG